MVAPFSSIVNECFSRCGPVSPHGSGDRSVKFNSDVLLSSAAAFDERKAEAERQAAIEEARSIVRVTKEAVSAPDSAGGDPKRGKAPRCKS